MRLYRLLIDGKNTGPITVEQICRMQENGRLSRETPCQPDGSETWLTLEDFFPSYPDIRESLLPRHSAGARVGVLTAFAALLVMAAGWVRWGPARAGRDGSRATKVSGSSEPRWEQAGVDSSGVVSYGVASYGVVSSGSRSFDARHSKVFEPYDPSAPTKVIRSVPKPVTGSVHSAPRPATTVPRVVAAPPVPTLATAVPPSRDDLLDANRFQVPLGQWVLANPSGGPDVRIRLVEDSHTFFVMESSRWSGRLRFEKSDRHEDRFLTRIGVYGGKTLYYVNRPHSEAGKRLFTWE